jgi:hypothetical protein
MLAVRVDLLPSIYLSDSLPPQTKLDGVLKSAKAKL